MDSSEEIIAMLEQLGARLDTIETMLDRISDSTSELQTQGALMSDDLAEIRRDIDRLEPGVI